LLPHSLCRRATANAPANRQMPIASVVRGKCKKKKDMNKSSIYEKRARLYPVIVSAVLPMILLIIIGSKLISDFTGLEKVWNILIAIIPASLITSAFIYFVKLVSRSTSKLLFQFPLFKEDETNMPTTNILLWKNSSMSIQRKILIRNKITTLIGIQLLNEQEERENETEARLLIADSVKQIREKTRDDEILFNYNCNFGFMRNLLGANVWSLLLFIIAIIIELFTDIVDIRLVLCFSGISIIMSLIAFVLLKHQGKEYANQLYTTFIELKI
jgi:hypothetical protein